MITRWILIVLPVLAAGCNGAGSPLVVPPEPPVVSVSVSLSLEPQATGALWIVATATNTGNTAVRYLAGCIDYGRYFQFIDPLGSDVAVFTGGGPRPLCPEWMAPLNPGESTMLTTAFGGVLLDEDGTYPAPPGRYGVSVRFDYRASELETWDHVTAGTTFDWNPQGGGM